MKLLAAMFVFFSISSAQAGGNLRVKNAEIYSTAPFANFFGTCADGLSIVITGAQQAKTDCKGGQFRFTAWQQKPGTYSYVFTQNEAAGGPMSAVAVWHRLP